MLFTAILLVGTPNQCRDWGGFLDVSLALKVTAGKEGGMWWRKKKTHSKNTFLYLKKGANNLQIIALNNAWLEAEHAFKKNIFFLTGEQSTKAGLEYPMDHWTTGLSPVQLTPQPNKSCTPMFFPNVHSWRLTHNFRRFSISKVSY